MGTLIIRHSETGIYGWTDFSPVVFKSQNISQVKVSTAKTAFRWRRWKRHNDGRRFCLWRFFSDETRRLAIFPTRESISGSFAAAVDEPLASFGLSVEEEGRSQRATRPDFNGLGTSGVGGEAACNEFKEKTSLNFEQQ